MESLGQNHVVRDGKFLVFVLGDDEYAIEILKVREIIGMQAVTAIPGAPDCIRGVINLRGRVIPIVDLCAKFLLPEHTETEASCTIVIEVRNVLMGVVVDTVSEVLDIAAEDIDPTPSFGLAVPAEYIGGMGKVKGKVKILLNMDAVLSTDELRAVAAADSG